MQRHLMMNTALGIRNDQRALLANPVSRGAESRCIRHCGETRVKTHRGVLHRTTPFQFVCAAMLRLVTV